MDRRLPASDGVPRCFKCGAPLTHDEISLTRKLVSRAAVKFMCLSCLAKEFDTDEVKLREMIARFRADGCTLFN